MVILIKCAADFISFMCSFLNCKALNIAREGSGDAVGQIQKMFHLQKSVKVEFLRNKKNHRE